jgi:hypothetical protein
MKTSTNDGSDFVQLLREFMVAYCELTTLFDNRSPDEISFASVRALVGDDNRSVLYRLKERSHALFRTDGTSRSRAVRREALFDLAIGSLFHEAMKLRESLYQLEVYAPRVASLKAVSSGDADELFVEFERLLGKSMSRLNEVVSEVRILLAQTRDQLRRLLIERSADRVVTRFLLRRRDAVSATFPEGFDGLLEAMHGEVVTGLVEAARSQLESAYFVEASQTLREAARRAGPGCTDLEPLLLYAEGMQAFLDGDYQASLANLESWIDAGAPDEEREFARLAALALSRLDRLVEDDETGSSCATWAKQLQLRLEMAPA